MRRTLYQIGLDDYKSELVFGLTDAWKVARSHIQKAQQRQKRSYDQHVKSRDICVGDRVMVYMPQERTEKQRKLNRPYYGPYRVLEVHTNGATVVPVDRPKDPQIQVNLDRVTLCYPKLPDVSWTRTKS